MEPVIPKWHAQVKTGLTPILEEAPMKEKGVISEESTVRLRSGSFTSVRGHMSSVSWGSADQLGNG